MFVNKFEYERVVLHLFVIPPIHLFVSQRVKEGTRIF